MKTMKETTNAKWTKLYEIKTSAKTPEEVARALQENTYETDFIPWDELLEEVKIEMSKGFIEVCLDGVIVWTN